MAAATNHWKLGLFVLIGAAMIVSSVAVLGVSSMHTETGRYVSYFDESVQGLEVGSPIKFRGVKIGTVRKIDVAPDHRMVEVHSDLGKGELSRLGLDVATGRVKLGAVKKLQQAIDLRVQLVSSGLTGVKFLQLDFFTVSDHPPPVLPFPQPRNYIPATASTMKHLQDSMMRTMNSLPEITDQVARVLDHIDALVAEVNERQLVRRAVAVVSATHQLVGETRRQVAQLRPARLSVRLEQTLAGFSVTAQRLNGILARIDSDRGLLKSVLRASNAFGDTARTAGGVGGQLEDTLRAVQEAARSIHTLAGALEKEPDMLVKGRERQR